MAAAQRIDSHLAEALEPSAPVQPIRPASRMPKRSRRRSKEPSPAYLEAQARMASLHTRVEPKLEAEPDPAPKKRQVVSEEDQRWTPHICAWRKTKLKLPEFCHQEGLNPAAMRKALTRHFKRAKQERQEQRP
ncbi:MAG: hypothetical protein ACR2QH_03030, partial [Geminicoccaceae bacterium]